MSDSIAGAVLFTPGDRPDRFDKAWSASGGALILDLEDAVPEERKPQARQAVREWIAAGAKPLVRVNAPSSAQFEADAAALRGLALRGIVISKAHSVADVATVHRLWPTAALYPLIESPEGLVDVVPIAAADGVVQLTLGALDLSAACGVEYPSVAFLDYARIQLTLASGIHGLAGPVDAPDPDFRDLSIVTAQAASAAKLGFVAKFCIHPAQLLAVNRAFAPSPEQIHWAEAIMAASGAGGVAVVDGAMVDRPVTLRAQSILARAQRMNAACGS